MKRRGSWDGKLSLKVREERVWHMSETGEETRLEPLTPQRVYAELAKRAHVEEAQGVKQEEVEEEQRRGVEEALVMLEAARVRMVGAQQVAQQLAQEEQGVLTRVHVSHRLPLVPQEAVLLAGAFAGRRAAYGTCGETLRRKAAEMRQAMQREKTFFGALRELDRKWVLKPGEGWQSQVSVNHSQPYDRLAPSERPWVQLQRDEDTGQVRVCALSAVSLYVNGVPVFEPLDCETRQVDLQLLQASHSYLSLVMLSLVQDGVPRVANNVTRVGDADVRASVCNMSETLQIALAPPEHVAADLSVSAPVILMLMHQLRRYRELDTTGTYPIYGQQSEEAVSCRQRTLQRLVDVYEHARLRRQVNKLIGQCASLRVLWDETEMRENEIHSACHVFCLRIEEPPLLGISLCNGVIYMDGKRATVLQLRHALEVMN